MVWELFDKNLNGFHPRYSVLIFACEVLNDPGSPGDRYGSEKTFLAVHTGFRARTGNIF